MDKHSRPFFGKKIYPKDQGIKIKKILSKYNDREVSEALLKEIYNELTQLKEAGQIDIPFKVFMRQDPTKKHRDHIEILLETQT